VPLEAEWSYTYVEVNGVWVPNSMVFKQSGAAEGIETRIEWVSQVVNEPLAADEFTMARMGAKDGVRVWDRIANVEYLYGHSGVTIRSESSQ